jgi:NTE family protein
MAIGSFSYMVAKHVKSIFLILLFSSCASLKKPTPIKPEAPKGTTVITNNDIKNVPTVPLVPPVVPTQVQPTEPELVVGEVPVQIIPSQGKAETKSVPRIGLIFSAGGAKTFGHIGVLKEIEKAKWPIRAVAGLEWGAAVAAIYGHQLSANEVEWEMSKLKSFEDVSEASQILFANTSVAELKIPFVCPSINLVKQESYLLNRGQLSQLMPFCLAHPPLSKAHNQSVGDLDNVAALAQHMRATGVNKVVFINVLMQKSKKSFVGDFGSPENILFVKAALQAYRKPQGVDDVIQINLDDYGIDELDEKREIIAKASELSYDQIVKLTKKYGL